MRPHDRRAVASVVNSLGDALDSGENVGEAAEDAREALSLLLERDDGAADESFESGARARVKISRGTGTRDQDEWVLEGKGRTNEDAAAEFDEMLDNFEDRWADRVRGMDPYEDE